MGVLAAKLCELGDFTDDFVEVSELWASSEYRPEKPCYVDFIRIAAISQGLLNVSDKNAALQGYVDKGVLTDVGVLEK